MASVKLQVSHAIPLGLIINEAVTNSVKYAFPDQRNGVVTISLLKEKQSISLSMKDNGVGLNTNVLEDEIKSMGIRLIQILADQIGGALQVSSMEGVSIEVIKIPYEDLLQSAFSNNVMSSVNHLV